MKTNSTKKHKKPIHLHLDHFFNMKAFLGIILGLFMIAMFKADSKLIGMAREAYAEGYGVIGSYMREETTRTPVTLNIGRVPTISGK